MRKSPCATSGIRIRWHNGRLTVRGGSIPGGELSIRYMEAYCRSRSTDRDWNETFIGHSTCLIEAPPDERLIRLRCNIHDGTVVEHVIKVNNNEIDFRLAAINPTKNSSDNQWGQPCIDVSKATGRTQESYLPQSFIFLDGKLTRLPTRQWARRARYTPGQVWCPKNVDRRDVNPRPLNPQVPSNGLIGVFSADNKMIVATAWEPYQELFQGVFCCIHSDFRIGGLKSGETKRIRGKIYIVDADVEVLRKRYERDFPEHIG